jgi:AmmeMemoRadiSam system protein A
MNKFMAALTASDKEFLVEFSRSVIQEALHKGKKIPAPASISPAVHEKRGCFVSLHQHGNLRGCIGTIEPEQALLKGVEENALNAAFRDPRFSPLTAKELLSTDIEVSVLTVPERLKFKDAEDLKSQLKPGIHGVILSKGWQRATFLPQVWEQLPDKEMFLKHLCQKAGMGSNCWKDPDTVVEVYKAEYFSE